MYFLDVQCCRALRFPTIHWPTVSGSLNNFPHTKYEEGFILDPLGKDTNLSLPVLRLF